MASPDANAHEALHELALEQQERDQQRCRRHERRCTDDRPIDAPPGRPLRDPTDKFEGGLL